MLREVLINIFNHYILQQVQNKWLAGHQTLPDAARGLGYSRCPLPQLGGTAGELLFGRGPAFTRAPAVARHATLRALAGHVDSSSASVKTTDKFLTTENGRFKRPAVNNEGWAILRQ